MGTMLTAQAAAAEKQLGQNKAPAAQNAAEQAAKEDQQAEENPGGPEMT